MLKTMKKTLAFVLMTTLVLTSMSFSVMAEVTKPSYRQTAADIPWTGDDVPAARMINPTKTNIINIGSVPSNKDNHLTVLEYADGVYGKMTDDLVYKVYDYSSRISDDLSQYGDITVGSLTAGSDGVLEFSFALSEQNSEIELLLRRTKVAGGTVDTSNFLVINSSGVSVLGKTPSQNISFDIGKWYNVALNIDVDNGDDATKYTHSLYINGQYVFSAQETASNKYNAITILRLGTNYDESDGVGCVYFDNITKSAIADIYTPNDVSPSTLTSNDAAIIIEGNGISVPSATTVGTLRQSLTSSNSGDNIRFYNSDYSAELLDDASAIDINVVVASPRVYNSSETRENTYSYYSTAKAVKHLSGLLDGDDNFSSVTNNKAVEYGVAGTNGKEADDKVYKLTSIGGVTNGTRANANLFPFAITTTTDTAVKAMFELQFMLPEGSKGIAIHNHYWGSSNDTSELWITPKGFGVKWSGNNDATYYTDGFDYNKWYTLSIVYNGRNEAGVGASSNTSDIYVNGELIRAGFDAHSVATYGIREVRLTSVLNNSAAGNADVVYAYVDNLRLVYGTTVPEYDMVDAFTTSLDTDLAADKIFIDGETTVADITSAITGLSEDSTLKIYNTSGAEVKEGAVSDGYTAVIAAKNGTDHVRTLSYYTVENIAGKFVIKTPVYSGEERTVNASFDTINNTGAPASVSAIMALYDYDGSLKKVTPVVCTTEGNKGSFAAGITMTADDDDDYIKFMIWASTTGDITPKMPDVILFDK